MLFALMKTHEVPQECGGRTTQVCPHESGWASQNGGSLCWVSKHKQFIWQTRLEAVRSWKESRKEAGATCSKAQMSKNIIHLETCQQFGAKDLQGENRTKDKSGARL